MKDKITLTDRGEIIYIAGLVEQNIKNLEGELASKQKFLRKFKDIDAK